MSWGGLGEVLGRIGEVLGIILGLMTRNIEFSWLGGPQEAEGTPQVEGNATHFGPGGSRGIAI